VPALLSPGQGGAGDAGRPVPGEEAPVATRVRLGEGRTK
jgi:hypothetical protein